MQLHVVSSCRISSKVTEMHRNIQEKRLRWYGNVVRRHEDHVISRATNMKVKRRRKKGRPRRKWMDCVREDLEEKQLRTEKTLKKAVENGGCSRLLKVEAHDHKWRPCLNWEKPEREEERRSLSAKGNLCKQQDCPLMEIRCSPLYQPSELAIQCQR